MKIIVLALGLAGAQLLAFGAAAQTPPSDPVRAERKQEAQKAARTPLLGEGRSQPEPRAKVSPQAKAEARTERRKDGAVAAKAANPGDSYSTMPEARPKVPKSERAAARVARNAEVSREVKAGEIKPIGEGSK
jgi:hypothetical protein